MVGNFRHLWILLLCFESVFSHSSFKTRIPNGHMVPHPCGNGIWSAVGHAQSYYVNTKNAFGKNFRSKGLNWQAVCRDDPDEDGLTNGEELGDPNCQFGVTQGFRPGPARGHPGFCEPTRRACKRSLSFADCPNDNVIGEGPRPRGPPVRTPPPHFGKHPQALLTERLSKQPPRFGSAPSRGSGLGDLGFDVGTSLGGGFSPAQGRSSFGTPRFAGDTRGSGGFSPDPEFSFNTQGQFELPRQTRPRSGSRSFDLRGPSSPRSTFDWSSGGFDSAPSGGFSGQFRGAEPAVAGSRFWQNSQGIPSRSLDSSRNSFATSLDQRFLQGGGSSGLGGMSFMSPGGQGVLQRSVQRRIQRARDSHSHRPGSSGQFMDWRGTGSTMEPQYPQFRGMGGGRSSRFMF